MKKIVLFLILVSLCSCGTNQENDFDNEVQAEVIYTTDAFVLYKKASVESNEVDFPVSIIANTEDLYYFDSLISYQSYYVEFEEDEFDLNEAIVKGLFTPEELLNFGVTDLKVTIGNPLYHEMELTYIYYSEDFRIFKYHSNISTMDFGGGFSHGEKQYSLWMQPSSESRTFLYEKDGEYIILQEALNRGYIEIDNFKYYGINRMYHWPYDVFGGQTDHVDITGILSEGIPLAEIELEETDED